MKKIIITESRFPAAQIRKNSEYRDVALFSLDGGHGNSAIDLADELDGKQSLDIWSQAYHFAQNWYMPFGQDITQYGAISAGKIAEIEMWYYWRYLFERIETIERILETAVPTEICLATFNNQQIRSILQDFLHSNVQIRMIQPSLRQHIAGWKNKDVVRTWLKTNNLDRHIRLSALFWSKWRNGSYPQTNKNRSISVLALLEQPGSYLADSILPILDFFPESGILLLDPRHQARASQAERTIIHQTDYLSRNISTYWQAKPFFTNRWNESQKNLSSTLQYKHQDLWPLVKTKLRHVFSRLFPITAMEVEGAKQLLTEQNIKSLLLATDAHHGGRLFTLVANQLNIPSLVVQHGATMGEWGYIPLYATKFAAWGEISTKWMVDRGTPPEKIVITGQPRLDQIANSTFSLTRASLSTKLSLAPDTFWLLWAMDPIPELENVAILQILLETLVQLPWCSLIIRPHPGIPQTKWISDILTSQEHKRVILSSAQEPLHEILHIVDAILIQESTVGIEAMALEKPVLLLQKEGLISSELYSQDTTVHTTNALELRHALEKLHQFQQSGAADPQAASRQDFIHRYLYKLDGQSKQRVAEAIAAMQEPMPTIKSAIYAKQT